MSPAGLAQARSSKASTALDERPLILVDVDGVLNALSCQDVSACKCHQNWVRVRVNGLPLLLNPAHGPMLLALAAETGGELAWGSMWENNANIYVAGVVGLPQLPWAPCTTSFSRYVNKAESVVPWAKGRPFVWFDDESYIPQAVFMRARQLHLVITVDDRTGLTAEDIDAARNWLTRLRGPG